MIKAARFIITFIGIFFAYHCTNCLIDVDRVAEHTSALYALFCSILLIVWGIFAPSTIK